MTETAPPSAESKPKSRSERFIGRLKELADKKDRAALAALKSGLGKPPGAAPRMYPYVAPYLWRDSGPDTEAKFLTAALFAMHSKQEDGVSLGRALKRCIGKHGEDGVTARFVAALDANPEDLHRHLQGLVSLCESASVPIDWQRFLYDVTDLLGHEPDKHDPRRLRRDLVKVRWARDFWRTEGDNREDKPQGKQQNEN